MIILTQAASAMRQVGTRETRGNLIQNEVREGFLEMLRLSLKGWMQNRLKG